MLPLVVVLIFHTGGNHALYELLLEQQEDDQHGNHRYHRHGNEAVPVYRELPAEVGKGQLNRIFVHIPDDQ